MELVKLKGTGDGVKIYLSPDAEVSACMRALHDKLDAFRKFFGNGHCNIYIIGRELTDSDKMRLEAIVSAMLPESTVNYGERRFWRSKKTEETEKSAEETENIEKTEQAENTEETEAPAEEIPIRQIKEVITSNFKSNRARFYEGIVKSGRIVESDGHLLLMGDVEEGGKLIAVGNVIVMGNIFGEIEAGCMGNEQAYVAALDLSPTLVKIAGVSGEIPPREEGEEIEPEKAYLINNEIKIEKFWLK